VGGEPAASERDDEDAFDAFISYRRFRGRLLARWLRDRLLRYALPDEVRDALDERAAPDARRAPRVFLDSVYEKAGDDFWRDKIVPNLDRSRHLIVVCTPDVFERRNDGQPNWAVREIATFVKRAGLERVIVVLGPGASEDRFPGALESKTNWDWVDLRRFSPLGRWRPGFAAAFDDAVSKIAARLYRVPDRLLPALYREDARRRARRLRRTLGVTLAVAGALAGLAAYAWWQRGVAQEQARLAQARELAAQATTLRLRQPYATPISALLAVRSATLAATPLAYTELQESLDLAAHLERVLATQISEPRAAFDAGTRRLVAAGSGGGHTLVEAWHVDPGTLAFRARVDASQARAALAPGGEIVALGLDDPAGPRPHRLRFYRWGAWSEPHDVEYDEDVEALAFDPSGTTLVVAGGKTVSAYDAASRQALARHTFDDQVAAFEFSPDGRRVAVAAGGRLHVMEHWRSPRPMTVLDEAVEGGTFALPTFDSRGLRLAAAFTRSSGGEGLLLATLGHPAAAQWLPSFSEVRALAFSPDSSLLAVGQFDGGTELLEVARTRRHARSSHEGMLRHVEQVAWSPDGSLLATLSADMTARVWRSAGGEEIARLTHRGDHLARLFFLDDARVLTIGRDNSFKVWRLDNAARPPWPGGDYRLFASDGEGRCVAAATRELFSPQVLVVACAPDWSPRWQREVRGSIEALAVDRRDDTLRVVAERRLWSYARWRERNPAEPRTVALPAQDHAALSADGSRLALPPSTDRARPPRPGSARNVTLYDARAGKELPLAEPIRLRGELGLSEMAYAPDGSALAVPAGPTTRVVALPSGRLVLEVPKTYPQTLAFDPLGRYLAIETAQRAQRDSANPPPLVELWDLRQGRRVSAQAVGAMALNDIAFAPDGSALAVASSDPQAVIVLEVPAMTEMGRIPLTSEAGAVHFLGDGRRLLIGAAEPQLRLWRLGDLARETCRRLGAPERGLLESHVPEATLVPLARGLDPVAICAAAEAAFAPSAKR
jgi:WD40 repeat protein